MPIQNVTVTHGETHLYRSRRPSPDQVPEIGRQNALQDSLLVLLRGARGAATAHNGGSWNEKRLEITLSNYE